MPVNLAEPPPQPPGVMNQTGRPLPPNPAASILSAGGSGIGAGAINPQGALQAQQQAVEKVLQQMASQSPVFASFAKRAIDIIQAGVQADMQAKSSGGPAPNSAGGNTMQPPADGGKASFPG